MSDYVTRAQLLATGKFTNEKLDWWQRNANFPPEGPYGWRIESLERYAAEETHVGSFRTQFGVDLQNLPKVGPGGKKRREKEQELQRARELLDDQEKRARSNPTVTAVAVWSRLRRNVQRLEKELEQDGGAS